MPAGMDPLQAMTLSDSHCCKFFEMTRELDEENYDLFEDANTLA